MTATALILAALEDQLVESLAALPDETTDADAGKALGVSRQKITSLRRKHADQIAKLRARAAKPKREPSREQVGQDLAADLRGQPRPRRDMHRIERNHEDRAKNDPVNPSLQTRPDYVIEVLAPNERGGHSWVMLTARDDLLAAKRACAGALARLTAVSARIVHQGEVVHTPSARPRRTERPNDFQQVEHGVYRRARDGAVLRKAHDPVTAKPSWRFEGIGALAGKEFKTRKLALNEVTRSVPTDDTLPA